MSSVPSPAASSLPRAAPTIDTFARALPSALLVAAAGAGMAWHEHGSIRATEWLPYAILAALSLGVVLLAGAAQRPSRGTLAAGAALVALAAIDVVSASWSPLPSLARDEGLLVLAYAIVFAVAVVTVRSATDRLAVVVAVVAAIAALAFAVATELWLNDGRAAYYDDGRLLYPLSYSNALAAYYALAFWPAVALAARRGSRFLRAVALASATTALASVLLTQSKGAVLGLAVGGIVFFAVCPLRLRILLVTALAALPAVAAYAPLTAPFRADEGSDLDRAISHAGLAVILLAALGALLGWAYATVDARVRVPARSRRIAGAAVLAALALALAGGIAGFAVAVDDPRDYVADKWEDFKRTPEQETGSSHLVNIGSNRWDAWRVAAHSFEEHPVLGVGARGFAPEYLLHRKSPEYLARAHSLEMDVLSETGLAGGLLLAAALAIPLALASRRARRAAGAAALLAACTAFVVHASVDWIWTFPAVGFPFFVLLGTAAAPERAQPLSGRVPRIAAGVIGLVVLLAFTPTWLAGRLTDHALENTATAGRDLRWARRLDPLSVGPLVTRARIAGSPERALPPLLRAAEIEPRNVGVRFALADTYRRLGRTRQALAEYRAAERLAPGDPIIAAALRSLGSSG